MKRFSIPCDVYGKEEKEIFKVIISNNFNSNYNPINFQSEWFLREKFGVVSHSVEDSFCNLYDLAQKNKLDFEELVLYSMKSAGCEILDYTTDESEEGGVISDCLPSEFLKYKKGNNNYLSSTLHKKFTNDGFYKMAHQDFIKSSNDVYEVLCALYEVAFLMDEGLHVFEEFVMSLTDVNAGIHQIAIALDTFGNIITPVNFKRLVKFFAHSSSRRKALIDEIIVSLLFEVSMDNFHKLELWRKMIYSFHELGQLKLAKEKVEFIIQKHPKIEQFYSQEGAILCSMQKYDEAIVACDKAISLGCEFSYENKAKSLSELGHHLEAAENYEIAFRNRGEAYLLHRAFWQYIKINDIEKALKILEEYAEYSSSIKVQEYFAGLSSCYLAVGDVDKSREIYAEYIVMEKERYKLKVIKESIDYLFMSRCYGMSEESLKIEKARVYDLIVASL